MRDRCKVRRIGFNQQAVDGDLSRNGPECFGIAKGDNTGERDVEAHIKRSMGRFPVLRETVHNATNRIRALFSQQPDRILCCFSGMDDQRFTSSASSTYVATKALLLPGHITLDTVVIKAGLPDRNNARIQRKLHQLIRRWVTTFLLIGVYPDGSKYIRVLTRQQQHLGELLYRHPHAQHVPNAIFAGILQDTGKIITEKLEVEVAMRVS